MEKAYIILAHKNPTQVARLIHSLDDNHSSFFLHLDKKINTTAYKELLLNNNRVYFINPVSTAWGSYGLVQATINGMNMVANNIAKFDFTILLSGQHYPIKSNEYIDHFLKEAGDHNFLEYTSIPNHKRWQPRGGLYRLDKYFFGLKPYQSLASKSLNFLSTYITFLGRKAPKNMKPYGGSQWWILTDYALRYVLNFVTNNKRYSSFHKNTFAPDELYFHNILLNTEDDKLRASIVNNNYLYMNWPDTNISSPEMLKSTDIDNIKQSDALFARKFDMDYDAKILDLVDEYRRSQKKNVI